MHVGKVPGDEGESSGLIHGVDELLLLGAQPAGRTLHLHRQQATVAHLTDHV